MLGPVVPSDRGGAALSGGRQQSHTALEYSLMHMRLRAGRAVALAGVLVALSAGLLSAAPMAANASVQPPGSTRIFHTCEGIGNDGTNRAVVCADLWSVPDTSMKFFGSKLYFGMNEVYCQNLRTRAYARCAGITETPAFGGSVTPPGVTGPAPVHGTFGGGQQICGTVLHHSACAARETVHEALTTKTIFPPFSTTRGERLTCAFWGESVRTSVRLPSGKTVSINVLATAHRTFTCVA